MEQQRSRVAAYGERSAIGRLLSLADRPDTEVRSGEGWVAVRTGLASNDLNGVVSLTSEGIDAALVADLAGWWGSTPASWLTPDPDPDLTALLADQGWHAERTGSWAGRPVADDLPDGSGAIPLGDPGDHLDVAQACGWSEPSERAARRALLAPHPLYTHVVVRRDGRAVGAATGFLGAALELVDVMVLPDARRAGVGTALVGALVAWGRERGATDVVAAPSPDGAALLGALGFEIVPVTPDVCSYWPGDDVATSR